MITGKFNIKLFYVFRRNKKIIIHIFRDTDACNVTFSLNSIIVDKLNLNIVNICYEIFHIKYKKS